MTPTTDRHDQHQPPRGALLILELAAIFDEVPGRQRHVLSIFDRTSATKLPRSRLRTFDMTTMRRWPSSRSTFTGPRVTSMCAT